MQTFNETFPAGLSKLHYTSPGEQFEEKFCFLKKMHFSSFWDTGREFLARLLNYFSTQLSGFSEKTVLCLSGTMMEAFLAFFRKNIRWVVKACFNISSRSFSVKMKFSRNCHILVKKFRVSSVTFWDIEMKLFCLLVENSLVDYQNCILRVRKNNLKQVFLKYVCSLTPLDFKWKFLAFINFLSPEIVKTAFYVSIRTFWENKFSRKIVFLFNFKIEWRLFQNVNDISPAGLPKLHYTSPG